MVYRKNIFNSYTLKDIYQKWLFKMSFRYFILCSTFLQFFYCLSYAQNNKDSSIGKLDGDLSPVYCIYEINSMFFSFPSKGIMLLIKPKNLVTGKKYFSRKFPNWRRINLHNKRDTDIPIGTIVKSFRGDCYRVDTLLFTKIKLKYPLEMNGKISDKIYYSNKNNPIVISNFSFVKKCHLFPFKHFEIKTERTLTY